MKAPRARAVILGVVVSVLSFWLFRAFTLELQGNSSGVADGGYLTRLLLVMQLSGAISLGAAAAALAMVAFPVTDAGLAWPRGSRAWLVASALAVAALLAWRVAAIFTLEGALCDLKPCSGAVAEAYRYGSRALFYGIAGNGPVIAQAVGFVAAATIGVAVGGALSNSTRLRTAALVVGIFTGGLVAAAAYLYRYADTFSGQLQHAASSSAVPADAVRAIADIGLLGLGTGLAVGLLILAAGSRGEARSQPWLVPAVLGASLLLGLPGAQFVGALVLHDPAVPLAAIPAVATLLVALSLLWAAVPGARTRTAPSRPGEGSARDQDHLAGRLA